MNVSQENSREVGDDDDELSEVDVADVAPSDVIAQPLALQKTEIAFSGTCRDSIGERSAAAIVCEVRSTSGSARVKPAASRLPRAAHRCATTSDVTSPTSRDFETDLQVSYERSSSNGFIETAAPMKGIEPHSIAAAATSADSTPSSAAADNVLITRRQRRLRCRHRCCRLLIHCWKTLTNVMPAEAVAHWFPAVVFLLLVGDLRFYVFFVLRIRLQVNVQKDRLSGGSSV
jgi:hypothetical protein